jgi:hypothetical protein
VTNSRNVLYHNLGTLSLDQGRFRMWRFVPYMFMMFFIIRSIRWPVVDSSWTTLPDSNKMAGYSYNILNPPLELLPARESMTPWDPGPYVFLKDEALLGWNSFMDSVTTVRRHQNLPTPWTEDRSVEGFLLLIAVVKEDRGRHRLRDNRFVNRYFSGSSYRIFPSMCLSMSTRI